MVEARLVAAGLLPGWCLPSFSSGLPSCLGQRGSAARPTVLWPV